MPDNHRNPTIWPIPVSQIEEIVAAHLGPGRVRGNAAGPCLSRQVSMYLAKHVAGWSLPKNGRFLNGRHHTTVLHGIGEIERLRKTDEPFDAFMDVLVATLASEGNRGPAVSTAHSELIDAAALRVIQRLREQPVDRRTIQATIVDVSASSGMRRPSRDSRSK